MSSPVAPPSPSAFMPNTPRSTSLGAATSTPCSPSNSVHAATAMTSAASDANSRRSSTCDRTENQDRKRKRHDLDRGFGAVPQCRATARAPPSRPGTPQIAVRARQSQASPARVRESQSRAVKCKRSATLSLDSELAPGRSSQIVALQRLRPMPRPRSHPTQCPTAHSPSDGADPLPARRLQSRTSGLIPERHPVARSTK
eukprot:290690-Rhodomonas_salina.3